MTGAAEAGGPELIIQRVQGTAESALHLVHDLVAAYLDWASGEQVARRRIVPENLPAIRRQVEQNVQDELPAMLGPRGRLLLARRGNEVVGLGGIKPVDGDAAEVKRMFVRPEHRNGGIARALLDELIEAGRYEGYRALRLETADFMTSAHALYRAAGFRDVPEFPGGEAAAIGVPHGMHFMELRL